MLDVRQMREDLFESGVSQNGEAEESLYSRTCYMCYIVRQYQDTCWEKSMVGFGFGTWDGSLDRLALGSFKEFLRPSLRLNSKCPDIVALFSLRRSRLVALVQFARLWRRRSSKIRDFGEVAPQKITGLEKRYIQKKITFGGQQFTRTIDLYWQVVTYQQQIGTSVRLLHRIL